MILDRISEAGRYTAAHRWFGEAFRFLGRSDLATIPAGRVDIDGPRVYALIMDVEGKGRDSARLETHRKYVDIQYVVSGLDVMGWRCASGGMAGEGYDEAKDIEFHRTAPAEWFDVPAGYFAVFFPADAHAPLAGKGPVRKVVVKVLAREP